MARSERGASLQGLKRASDAARRPFCLAPHGFALFLALAGVARSVEMARISTLRSRLGQRQKQQQRDPLQYFNSLLSHHPNLTNIMSHRSIIVLPDDTGKPIIDAINAAKKSVRVKMFIFSDPDLIKAVIKAKERGAQNPGHAQSRAPERRRGECRDAQGARASRG